MNYGNKATLLFIVINIRRHGSPVATFTKETTRIAVAIFTEETTRMAVAIFTEETT